MTPVEDVFHEKESDPEKVSITPVPTINPVPVDPVETTDQVSIIVLPVEVFPVDTIPVLIEPEKVFFGKFVILATPSSCNSCTGGNRASSRC